MPAAGYKLFVTGDVLTAAQVNDYLMLQTVMVFANSAARTSALSAVLAEGLVSYLQDTNVVEIYTGAAWVSLDDPNAIQNSIVDAKGDIITATADNTPSRLAVGANDTVLTADSSTATGLKWATPSGGGGGKVLQVVNATTTTVVSSSTNTYVDTTLTATITPTLATSKILVLVDQNGAYKNPSSADNCLAVRLLRGATEISIMGTEIGYTNSAERWVGPAGGLCYLDSPATTSATTYKTQFKSQNNTGIVYIQSAAGGTTAMSTITLLEIGV